MIFLPFVFTLWLFFGSVEDQVYIKQRYLTQVKIKHDNLEIVLIFFQRMLLLLFIAAVRRVSLFFSRGFLLLCGDIEKILDPLMLQNSLLWMTFYLALKWP